MAIDYKNKIKEYTDIKLIEDTNNSKDIDLEYDSSLANLAMDHVSKIFAATINPIFELLNVETELSVNNNYNPKLLPNKHCIADEQRNQLQSHLKSSIVNLERKNDEMIKDGSIINS